MVPDETDSLARLDFITRANALLFTFACFHPGKGKIIKGFTNEYCTSYIENIDTEKNEIYIFFQIRSPIT